MMDAGFWMLDALGLREINSEVGGMETQSGGSWRNLEVHGLAHSLGVLIHKFSLRLPRFDLYETGSQLRRASKSISENIVEGYGRRRYKAEFVRFLVYALASCDETVECLEYVRDCHDGLLSEAVTLLQKMDELGKKLNRFLQSVEAGHRSPK